MKENTFTSQTSEQIYTVKGKASFPDGFYYQTMDVQGKLDFLGTGNADSLTVSGKTQGENLLGKKMVLKGRVDLEKLQTQEVKISGACKIASVESKTVEIVFSNASYVEKLQAESITLKPVPEDERQRNLNFFKGSWFREINKFVRLDRIEESIRELNENCFMYLKSIKGENIYLENVKADLVEGKNIVLGPNCTIKKTIHL